MFKPDDPITSYKEDILGRSSFSKKFGEAITSYKDTKSIVIGLFGKWGSGKTSIINMALEQIDEIYTDNVKEKPVIFSFNPWNFSNQNQLISQFFKQLSIALGKVDYAGNAKDIGKKLEAYARIFEPLVLVPQITPIALLVTTLFKKVAKAATSWGDLKSNDLNALKNELSTLLEKESRKIIVLIDDIDRLSNEEIRQIFQLVKLIGDFKNTMYLLSLDKEVVIKALEKVQEGNGSEYLDKVVQIPFETPKISKQEVEKLLFNKLDELIGDIPEKKWDKTYWGNIYHSGIKHFFSNIREVNRYINTLSFSLELVKEEVNAIDFIAITAIQVFIPELYIGIRDNKDIFAGVIDTGYRSSESEKKQAQERCNEIIDRANNIDSEIIKDFLKQLFPKLESLYGNTNYGHEWEEGWRREGRIACKDNFDTFFKLSLPVGELSRKEIETIISLADDPETFKESLSKLVEDARIIRFLERLEDYTKQDIDVKYVKNIISVLLDMGDSFPDNKQSYFMIETPLMIARICHQLIKRIENQNDRFMILKRTILDTKQSINTVVHEVSLLNQEQGNTDSNKQVEPEDKRKVNPKQFEELKTIVLGKISDWVERNKKLPTKFLPYILFRWKEWGNKADLEKYVNSHTETAEGLVDFISGFLSKTTSYGMNNYVGEINWRINLKETAAFIDNEKVLERLKIIKTT
ncbi:P-loop NTPase fold protein, partial [Elusimicrobiota bacterium]